MTVYYGKMQMAGDSNMLPAAVRVEMGTIALATGQTELGEWKLYQVGMSELDQWIVLEIESEKVYLELPERERFLEETKTYRRDESKNRFRRRQGEKEHAAFVKNRPAPPQESRSPDPAMSERIRSEADRIKSEMVTEAAPLREVLAGVFEKMPKGWPLGLIVVVIAIASIFVPRLAGIMFGICMAVGMVAVLAGGVGYVDTGFGVRYPDKLSPARLMVYGGLLLLVSIPFGIIS